MQSGMVVEDWAAEKSELETEPVPARRRHAWHKKLLKTVRGLHSLYSRHAGPTNR
jgi:hypothetical protein